MESKVKNGVCIFNSIGVVCERTTERRYGFVISATSTEKQNENYTKDGIINKNNKPQSRFIKFIISFVSRKSLYVGI